MQQLGWALRVRWLWLPKKKKKTEPDEPRAVLPRQVHQSVKSFFSVAIISEVGNGRNTLFWNDKWIHGQNLDQLVPHLFGSISNQAKRTVYETLTDRIWVTDIKGARTLDVLVE